MRIMLQSLVGSIVIHIVFFITTIGIGFLKTKAYEPEILGDVDDVTLLENEVAFGVAVSPVSYIVSFVGIALICGMLILGYEKYKGLKER